MNYVIACQATFLGKAATDVWTVWSDLASYPKWDPREEVNRPNGPLAAGTTGTFKQRGRGAGSYTITAVEPGRRWVSETSLPGGRLVIDHHVDPVGDGTMVTKTYTVEGPMAVAFRWFFGRGIRAEMPGSFGALEAEVARRSNAAKQ